MYIMKFPWTIKKKINTPAEKKIEEIIKILFPPLDIDEKIEQDGSSIKFHIDYSVDSNLDAALMDLQDGNNDEIVHNTITKVIKRLNKVRRLLEANAKLDSEAKYIIVDDLDEENRREIVASDD